MELISGFLPTPGQALGLGAVLAAAWLLSLLGAVAGWRDRMAEADLVCGWAIATVVVVLLGGFGGLGLSRIFLGLLAAALVSGAATWANERRIGPPGSLRLVALALPVLVIGAAMQASQWDEFSQWLHSTLFLLSTDTLPDAQRPDTGASYPAYPYAMPVAGYAASRIAGRFVENAGALFNIVLLISLAGLLVRLAATAAGSGRGWGLHAAALLGVTLLSPTFVPKIVFTSYADSATAVATAFAGVLGWACLGALAGDDAPRARTLALRCGLALLVLVSLKQGNAGLVAAVLLGIAAAAAADPSVPFLRTLRLSPLAFGPPVAMWGAWEAYVAWQIPGGGFQSVQPDLSLVPQVFAAMLDVALHKGGFFGLMLIIFGLAAKALWRFRGELDRLAVLAATAFIVYVLFLLWAYIYRFDPYEAVRAASFWRYSTHLGGLALAVAAVALGMAWRRQGGWRPAAKLGPAAVAAVVLLPIALEQKLRFDRHPVKQQVREVGAAIADILPPGARLLVIDPMDPGLYGKMVNFELGRAGRSGIVGAMHGEQTPAEAITGTIDRSGSTHLWVHTATSAVGSALGLDVPPGASHLLERQDGGWRIVRSWPYRGYSDPSMVRD
ncbi:MAG: hypothetical protein WD270_02325 [Acetobacterales bacterium]